MTLTIHPDVVQGSDEWLDQRRGIVTASVAKQILTTRRLSGIDYPCPACQAEANNPCIGKRSPAPIKSLHPERTEFARSQGPVSVIESVSPGEIRPLVALLAAERITGWTDPSYISDEMLRGMDDEPIAREIYAERFAPVREVGFIVEDKWGFKIGYSPDGLVGDDGMIEIKSRRSKLHLMTILEDDVPPEYMAQLQCGLLVSGRRWIDYVSYCGGMPLWRKRVTPQKKWFDAIVAAVDAFEKTAADMIRQYGEKTVGLHPTQRRLIQEIKI